MRDLAPERLVFLDETGTHVAMTRDCAWSPIGQRAHDVVVRNRGRVLTVLGAIALDGVRAVMTVEGGTSREVFLRFAREHLCPSLRRGDVVVMDNLAAHHVREVRRVIEESGATVLFLPPYSPEMNPIEICWAKLKALIRAGRATTQRHLDELVHRAAAAVTPSDLAGWFKHCGYQPQPG
jgi:transposase